jgi:hypothetical protein
LAQGRDGQQREEGGKGLHFSRPLTARICCANFGAL